MRARARVTGRVQGVSFRVYTMQEATRGKVVGWVRNEPDGAVLLEAEGEQAAVEQLLEWCHKGPAAGRVKNVEVEWIDPLGSETSFRIRH